MSRIPKTSAFHSRAQLLPKYVIYLLVPLFIWMSCVTITGMGRELCVSMIPRGFVAAYNTAVLPTRIRSVREAPANRPVKKPHNPPPRLVDGPNTHIPWLIVGGGIHGVHIAARLIGEGGINASSIRIIDTNKSLLQTWKSRTAATGMEYLRSSAGFHLDVDERSLRQFGGSTSKKKRKKKTDNVNIRTLKRNDAFSNDYERPRLAMFNEHCDSVVTKYHLDQLHVQGTVTSMEPSPNHVTVEVMRGGPPNYDFGGTEQDMRKETHSYSYTAQNVILALGNDVPTYADWVTDEDIEEGFVHHLLDFDPNTHSPRNHNREMSVRNERTFDEDVAVIGGGITAAHKALELVRHSAAKQGQTTSATRNSRRIHLISRHPIKEQQFDTHQDWMMDLAACQRIRDGGGEGRPQRQERFAGCSCWKERRSMIAQERVAGTVTPALYRGEQGLGWAIEGGEVDWHQAEVLTKRYVHETDTVNGHDHKRMELTLSCGNVITVDEVLLATGFGKKRPGGALINNLVETFGLRVSDFCGFPIVDEHLSWDNSRIYVAGALAELELGPSARNIAGARLAAERILQAAHELRP
mmetsp:Transcript_24976/g.30699  ORF Transcript_24976/g.30699 Transcript_24976/m.30699 type:complete len:581 (+) Transcript_24976:67-1809(+)